MNAKLYGKVTAVAAALAIAALMWFWAPAAARRVFAVSDTGGKDIPAELGKLSRQEHVSALFRAVAKADKPAVVVVHVKQRLAAAEGMPMPEMNQFLRRFFGEQTPESFRRFRQQPRPRLQPPGEFFQRGFGSGVIVDAAKGYVLTNWHVVRGAENVEVVLHDGRKMDAEWVRSDEPTDLAIIKIKPERLYAAPLGNSDEMEVGDLVLAIGAPEGLPQTVTSGIISAKGRVTGQAGYESFLQTDAAINHGNSGGPLVNMRGEVIGINAAIISQTGVNEGIGLAIPSNMARHVMEQLISNGSVTRGYLGVVIQNVDEKLARSFSLPDTHGALVAEVSPDTPAAKAGVKAGDFVTAVNGKAVENVNTLRNRIAEMAPGAKVALEVYRDGKKETIHVELGKLPEEMAAAGGKEAPTTHFDKLGLAVATLNADMAGKYNLPKDAKGVVITAVDPQSGAAEQGLTEGALVVEVQGKDVKTAEEFNTAIAAVKDHAGVRLLVRAADGTQRFVFLTFPKGKTTK